MSAHEQCQRAKRRKQCGPPGIRRHPIVRQHRDADHDEAGDLHQDRARCAAVRRIAHHERGRAAERELPDPRGHAEERPRLRRGRQPEARDERDRAGDRDANQQLLARDGIAVVAFVAELALVNERDQQKQQRPDEIELFFHRERPRVQQRILARGEVVDSAARKLDVAGIHGDGTRGPGNRDAIDWRVQPHDGRECRQQDDEQWRQQPQRPSSVERGEVDVARLVPLAHEQAGDEEPREHEEDVDAHEAAGQRRYPRVKEHDEKDREAAEAFEVGAEFRLRRHWDFLRRGESRGCKGRREPTAPAL